MTLFCEVLFMLTYTYDYGLRAVIFIFVNTCIHFQILKMADLMEKLQQVTLRVWASVLVLLLFCFSKVSAAYFRKDFFTFLRNNDQ